MTPWNASGRIGAVCALEQPSPPHRALLIGDAPGSSRIPPRRVVGERAGSGARARHHLLAAAHQRVSSCCLWTEDEAIPLPATAVRQQAEDERQEQEGPDLPEQKAGR
ncbi:hypothetical protein [Streptomyces sp. Ac-502]|uniref:hypothetical protein n=1 Tax=Streptomyces sp. Ac-502 TaxID=3342801 RepID=UPI0038627634